MGAQLEGASKHLLTKLIDCHSMDSPVPSIAPCCLQAMRANRHLEEPALHKRLAVYARSGRKLSGRIRSASKLPKEDPEEEQDGQHSCTGPMREWPEAWLVASLPWGVHELWPCQKSQPNPGSEQTMPLETTHTPRPPLAPLQTTHRCGNQCWRAGKEESGDEKVPISET